MTSCLASSSNMGSSKNLLMETSSLRPCGEKRGRGGGKERGGERGEGEEDEREGGEGATIRLGPWTNRVCLVTKCEEGLLEDGHMPRVCMFDTLPHTVTQHESLHTQWSSVTEILSRSLSKFLEGLGVQKQKHIDLRRARRWHQSPGPTNNAG